MPSVLSGITLVAGNFSTIGALHLVVCQKELVRVAL